MSSFSVVFSFHLYAGFLVSTHSKHFCVHIYFLNLQFISDESQVAYSSLLNYTKSGRKGYFSCDCKKKLTDLWQNLSKENGKHWDRMHITVGRVEPGLSMALNEERLPVFLLTRLWTWWCAVGTFDSHRNALCNPTRLQNWKNKPHKKKNRISCDRLVKPNKRTKAERSNFQRPVHTKEVCIHSSFDLHVCK